MPEWTLRQAEYFLAVVNHGSVSGAASAIHVSQGALSMAMTQLEASLGVQLLTRAKSQPARPTPAGLEFADRLRTIMDMVEDATAVVSDSTGVLSGSVAFGTSNSLSPEVFPPLLERFRTRWPKVRTSIHELLPAEVQAQVQGGLLDVGFLYRQQVTTPLTQHVIRPVRLHAVLAADHPLASRKTVTPPDLAPLPAILPDSPPTPQILMALLARAGYEPEMLWESKNQETVRALVGRGLGFSLANAVPATGHTFGGGSVRYIPIDGIESRNAIVALTDPGRRLSRTVVEAIAVLRSGS